MSNVPHRSTRTVGLPLDRARHANLSILDGRFNNPCANKTRGGETPRTGGRAVLRKERAPGEDSRWLVHGPDKDAIKLDRCPRPTQAPSPWPGQGIIARRISYYLYVLTLTWSGSWSSLHDDVDFPMMRLLQSLRFAL